MKPFASFILFLSTVVLHAQPGTEIFLFDLESNAGGLKLTNGVNITNRKGYDNQPFFHPREAKLYFVSADSTGETDIMIYDIANKTTTAFTDTPDREYSPTVTLDGKNISCIIQRENGQQDLARYPAEGGPEKVLIDDLTVGYHVWLTTDKVGVFTLPAPFKFEIVDFTENSSSTLADSIGRSLHRMPGGKAISYIENIKGRKYIRRYDVKKATVTSLVPTVPCQECDMAWTPDGKILMSDGRKIFFLKPGKSEQWKEVQIENAPAAVSRLMVSPKGDKVALVVAE